MSEMEHNKGTLLEVPWEAITLEYPDADPDDLEWTTEENFARIGNKFFHVQYEVRRGDLDYVNILNEVSNGLYQFETYHYNGGAHWTELVERNLKKLEEKQWI